MKLAVRFYGIKRLCQRAVQERDDLPAGAGIRWRKGVHRLAVGDAVFKGPEDRIIGIAQLVQHVRKGRGLHGRVRLAGGAPQEGRHLLAGAGACGAEVRVVRAVRDALAHGPDRGVVEVVRGLHVHKRVLARHLLGTESSPQERDDLAALAGVRRAEGRGACAVGDLGIMVHRPAHGFAVIRAVCHVGEARGRRAERQQRQRHAQHQQHGNPVLSFHGILPPYRVY